MKKFLALCLLLLLIPCLGAAEEIILNKTRGDHADFAFAEDAKLLEIFFPQVFGCDAALVRYGEQTMLIDCAGNKWKTVKQTLDKLGVTELTYALNSHPDADHIGGFNRVLKDIPAGEFLLGFPEDHDSGDEVRFQVYEDLHAMGIPFRRVHHGDTIEFGDVSMTVYQRTDDHLPRVNNKSVMLMIQYGERRIFFTGDVQAAAQELLGTNEEGLDLDCDILKFPHHGYDRMQNEFLDVTKPELVICTCGDAKTEGIKQLKERKISYQMTANQTLRLATDGKVWTVEKIPMKIK
ncbi:MAG: MBL fold metallo-hydrolase [Clostridia bacterium]|nr:MBL fold metallo-hydrolase [Clostridia bacterium]